MVAACSPGATLAQETFHSGGVGHCGGCHSTHEPTASGSWLLLEDNPTDLCLRCHERGNGNSWGGSVTAPGPIYGGGPFVFLLEDNLNDAPGGNDPANWIPGHQAGHNVISARRGTTIDPVFSQSPGGNYPSDNLHCTSCHDPHGRGGHYRLLYGSDYPDAVVNGRTFLYTRPAPDAVGIPLDGNQESDANHNAYRQGLSDWCANCHDLYHDQVGDQNFEHPSDRPLGGHANTYNAYRGTDFYDGDGATAYIATVPVEHPAMTSGFRGPIDNNSRVNCLSCHRAHASSAPRSGRWDFNITTWAEEGVLSGSWPIPNPYDTTAGQAQQGLCEKCHGPNVPDRPSPERDVPPGGSRLDRRRR